MVPIYRAKRLDRDEYIEGYYFQYNSIDQGLLHSINCISDNDHHVIDINTLSIHFENMIDKNGKKIFASLSEDGVGGDEVKGEDELLTFVSRYERNGFRFCHSGIEVIGIHKGE